MTQGFKNCKEMVEAELSGAYCVSSFRKVPTVVTTARYWFDMSLSPGNPKPQYYAATPLTATQMSYSANGGLYHGAAVSPAKKYLKRLCVFNNVSGLFPIYVRVVDYLLFYPFVETSSAIPQVMDNTITLPRYTDGKGVQIMPVIVGGGDAAAAVHTFTVSYTNSDGVAGRTTKPTAVTNSNIVGTLATSSWNGTQTSGPFLPLQTGDSGVRSIQSMQVTGTPDTGLLCFVLVKPIAGLSVLEALVPSEVEYFVDTATLPEIKDNAYLNFIVSTNGNANMSGSITQGLMEVIWG